MTQHKKYIYLLTLFAALLLAGFMHGVNMFHFPYYESDEGTYTSQAWSLVKKGELAPYTYWYDHPPVGWMTMAGWATLLQGDFFFFGESSIDNMRVFMLVVHVLTAGCIFFIAHKMTRSVLVAFFAVMLFSVSPLFIYFQRRVLLDNIMTLFIMASLATLFVSQIKLRHYIVSALLFAAAVLVKVPAIIFAPAFLVFVIYKHARVSPIFRTTLWIVIFVLVGTVYLLYALLRGELLPDTVTGGSHVSFLSSFLFQLERGSGSVPFWNATSYFRAALDEWFLKDAAIIWGIALSFGLGFLAAHKNTSIKYILFFNILYLGFLVRGGIVTDFYIVPILPFSAILFATSIFALLQYLPQRFFVRTSALLLVISGIGVYYTFAVPHDYFTRDETSQQIAATRWIKTHITTEKAIIMDSYALVDLWDPTYVNTKTFTNADWFYKINRDTEIRDEKYFADWRNIDYVFVNHELLTQMGKSDNYPITKEAFLHARPVAKWTDGTSAYIDEQKFISTNGDWGMLYAVNDASQDQLLSAWTFYKEQFIHGYGQVIDPIYDHTTSEGQGYAMLQAVWMNDFATFDGLWQWTQSHLQYRTTDKLFSQTWQGESVTVTANLTGADADIALALLFASRLWDKDAYYHAAQDIIADLWTNNVVEITGTYYMLPMHITSSTHDHGYLLNPSQFSPAAYRIFADVDQSHPWDALADDTYVVLHRISTAQGNTTALVPDWLFVDAETGVLSSAQKYFTQDVDDFGYDAFRTLWRVALDARWYNTPAAYAYLHRVNAFIVPFYQKNGTLPAIIALNGTVKDARHALAVDGGYLSALATYRDAEVSFDFYRAFFEEKRDPTGRFWETPDHLYRAHWAWLSVGLFHDDLPNMWAQQFFMQ